MIVFCANAQNAHAQRRFRIPVLYGYSEECKEICELPPNVAPALEAELGAKVKVAFLYERVHLFWLDLWTWNGRHVLTKGDQYFEPSSTSWQKMIGDKPSARYGRPMLYRIPLLPALLVLGGTGYALIKRFPKVQQDPLDLLEKDLRYQQSIATIFRQGEEQKGGKAITTLDEQRFQVAKKDLIAQGVDEKTAEANLRKIAIAILANTNARIDESFALASQLDQHGHLWESSKIYSQIIDTLPSDDERLIYAKTCLDSINQRMAKQTQ